MSAAQAIASERFITAMGPMVANEEKMERVIRFISLIRDDAPCRFSEEEIRSMGLQAKERAQQGVGISHIEAKQMATQWVR